MALIYNFGYKVSWEKIIFCKVFELYLNNHTSAQFWKLDGVLNQVEHNTLVKFEISTEFLFDFFEGHATESKIYFYT